jgi:mannose-6-phosphate isomerase
VGRAVETTSLQQLLNFIPVRRGDVLFIPAGTVHAILDGVLIYEVQESSGTTLRLYDWGRKDAEGKTRPLHVRDALPVLDTCARDGYRLPPVAIETFPGGCERALRAACRHFAIEQYSFSRDEQVILPPKRSFRVLSVMSGALRLHYPSGSAAVPLGGTALLPAALRDVHAVGAAGTSLIVTWVPDLHAEVVLPLRQKGVPDDRIMALGGSPGRNDLARHLR